MSAAPARFTFDLDLGRRPENNRLLPESAAATLAANAREEGYREGFAAGEQGVTASAAHELAAAATALGNRVAAMAAEMDETRKVTIGEATALAASIAHKLASGLVAREPTAEIEALITECLASLNAAPHLVIRCNDELAEAVRNVATGRVQASGFSGRLVVMGDPDIAAGDCRLEWVDGGLVRDQAAIAAQIDNRIAAFLAARGIDNGATRAEETDHGHG